MVSFSWTPTTPLSRTLVAGHHGANAGAAGVALAELSGFELVQIMARRGQWEATAKVARQHFKAKAPTTPLTVRAGETMLIWSGPGQFLALAARTGSGSTMDAARQAFAGKASLSEQSDGRALIRISGLSARKMLAKFCSLDLHPAAFPAGSAAATSIDHTPVNLWRAPDAGGGAVFDLLVFSSFAESLWRMMLDSGAEYGIAIAAPGAWQP